MGNRRVYAIIPARSGSKGVKNKNTRMLAGQPLLSYSINFAKKLNLDKIICSTDSSQYAAIAQKYGAQVPFLRSAHAAKDTSMEHDILQDMFVKFKEHGMEIPEFLVWLRPTFVFRDKIAVEKCIEVLLQHKEYTAARVIVESEARLYKIDANGQVLYPNFNDDGKSMIRRQDIGVHYKVFNTDVIRFNEGNLNDNFLGNKVYGLPVNKICGLDIDDETDFQLVETLIENCKNLVHEYLP